MEISHLDWMLSSRVFNGEITQFIAIYCAEMPDGKGTLYLHGKPFFEGEFFTHHNEYGGMEPFHDGEGMRLRPEQKTVPTIHGEGVICQNQ